MNSWPREITADEAIVRGACSPYHFKRNGILHFNVYWPPHDSDEISTMRIDWIGPNACKRHAKNLEDPAKDKVYKGFAVLSAGQIRQAGADVVDTRHIFKGHSDIKHGIVRSSRGNPAPPEKLKELRSRCKELARLANYIPDPDPASANWNGPPLRYKK